MGIHRQHILDFGDPAIREDEQEMPNGNLGSMSSRRDIVINIASMRVRVCVSLVGMFLPGEHP
jgi:hypothetical protein